MTTLEGRHPLIAIRTRARRRASLLEVMLIALVTLGVAVAIAFAIRDNGGTGASQPAVAAKHAPATQATTVSLPPDVRYDGGPEEGTRGPSLPPDVRYDGGPEEGTRGALQITQSSSVSPGLRYEHGVPSANGSGR